MSEMTPEMMALLGIKDPATVELVRDDGSSEVLEIPREFWGVSHMEVVRGLNRLFNQACTEAGLTARPLHTPLPDFDPFAARWPLSG